MTHRATTLVLALLLPGLLLSSCRAAERDEPAAAAVPAGPSSAAGPATDRPSRGGQGAATSPVPSTTREPAGAAQSWTRIGPPPDLPRDRPLRAGFLVVDGVYSTELAAPYDVLHHTRFHARPHGIEVFTVSPDGRPVTTFEGLKLTPDHAFANAPEIDILVVPSTSGSMDRDLEDRALVDWVRRVGGSARYVISLCDGAFVLARAGLLDGVAATTFPDDYDRFAQMFPAVEHRINVSFVRDGKFLTSQGGALSYDVAMYLVDDLFGEEVATKVGHGLLVPWPPDLDRQPPFAIEAPGAQGAAASPAQPGS